MILAFQLSDIITVPFGWLLGQLYNLTSNYGVAMIIFALIVQTILLPIRAKSKKSSMKMSRVTPRVQEIQKKYANDPQKQNEMMQRLYQEEGISMGGGCLWSLVPMLILFPLFSVIRQPITYMLGETAEMAQQIIDVIKAADATALAGNEYYIQVFAAQAIPQFAAELKAAIPGISAATLEGINFNFLGINLGAIPNWKIWAWDAWNWANIGAFMIPLISAASQYLQTWFIQKSNDSVVTDQNGVQDKETAANSSAAQSTKTMLLMMPLMSLWIGYTVSAGLSLYWFIGGLYSMVTDAFMTRHYRKIYDAEDAERMKRYLEQERIEAEKERIRAERRAANPEGITSNTSKKKLQKQQRDEEAAAKAAAAKDYAAKKGIAYEEDEAKTVMSGIPSRPYCKGRNYDPNRYSNASTEE